jgi:putative nucleotidyltransferase with HDIG domain
MSALPLNRQTAGYVTAVVIAGFAAVSHSALSAATNPPDARWLLLAALTLVSGSANLRLTAVSATISVSETFVCTSVLLFGAAAGTLTVALDAVVMSLWMQRRYRNEPYRLLFNVAAPAISVWLAAQTFALGGIPPLATYSGSVHLIELAAPLLVFTVSYFLLNSWLIAFAISLQENLPAYPVWREHFLWTSLNYFGGASVAALLVGYRGSVDVTLLLVVAPILLVLHFTFRTVLGRVEDSNQHLARVNKLYLSTIETLATAIDAKDQVTHGHIRRVQYFALALARAVGVREEAQTRAIEAAALLHDMGKLAVPDYILNKPGPLTTSEFSKMMTHAATGAEILESIDFPYPVVPIVRHHHENWDGTGYPDALKGTEIPIGARILSVVDCFDALTSDRPYRKKLPDTTALQILATRRGTMYDPLVVDAFLANYHDFLAGMRPIAESAEGAALVAIAESGGSVKPSSLDAEIIEEDHTEVVDSVCEQPAIEFVNSLSKKLVDCTVVLFMKDDSLDALRVQVAVGPRSRKFADLTVSLTQRVVGWVAANATCIHNADRGLDILSGDIPGTCTGVPLLRAGRAIGVIAIYTEGTRVLTASELGELEDGVVALRLDRAPASAR